MQNYSFIIGNSTHHHSLVLSYNKHGSSIVIKNIGGQTDFRLRKLSEMDSHTLSYFDFMTIGSVDYIENN